MKEEVPTAWITQFEFWQTDAREHHELWSVRVFFADGAFKIYHDQDVVRGIRDKLMAQMSGGSQ